VKPGLTIPGLARFYSAVFGFATTTTIRGGVGDIFVSQHLDLPVARARCKDDLAYPQADTYTPLLKSWP
jgi:hypothetical protein